MNKTLNKNAWSLFLANAFDNFDVNVYAFLVPIISPLFFPNYDYIVQLILGYSFLLLTVISRPVGVFIFGYLAKKTDVNFLLKITLLGVGFSTFCIGLLPTYKSIGYYAPALLFVLRLVTSLFAQGEKTLVSVYFAQNVKYNAFYEISTIFGCLLASMVATYISVEFWRLPFLLGGLLSLFAFAMRTTSLSVVELSDVKNKKQSIKLILFAIVASGLGYVTYDLSFVLMNSFVPLVTEITNFEMMQWNTILMLADLILFFPIGWLISYLLQSKSVKLTHLISYTSISLCLPAIPFFFFMNNASIYYVLFVRVWIVVWGIVFACVMNVRLLEMSQYANNYLFLGVTNAIGAGLIGRSTSSISLGIYSYTNWVFAPGLYLFLVGFLVFLLNYYTKHCGEESSYVKK